MSLQNSEHEKMAADLGGENTACEVQGGEVWQNQIKVLINTGELEEHLRMSSSVETNVFVSSATRRLFDTGISIWINKVFDAFPVASCHSARFTVA